MKTGLILIALCLAAFCDDTWPRFRGPDGAGVSAAALPEALGPETLVWSAKLPGPGSSSPVIWKDKLFVTSEDREAKSLTLVCLHAHSGQSLWAKTFPVGDYHLHRFNNTAAATPTVNERLVLLSHYDGKTETARLTALSHGGKKLWDFDLGPFKSQHGFNLHPVIHGETVIVSPLHLETGYLAALSLDDGKLLWKTSYPGDKTSYVTPLIRSTEEGGSEVIVASQANGVLALDTATGKETWSLPDTMKQRTIVSPVNILAGSDSSDCLVAVGCKNGVYFAVRPPRKAGSSAGIAWRMKGRTPYVPTPVSNGRTVFVLSDGGTLSALAANTGETRWTEELRANFYASPVLADGKLYALTREGTLIVARVKNGYEEISRQSLSPEPAGASTDATPALAHHRIYLRLGKRLDCHGKKS